MSQGFYGFPNILGLLRGTTLKVTGKAGATAGAGLAGGTTSGAPTAPAGPFDLGEVIVDQSGSLWICTTAGTSQSSPGSFTQVAGFGDPTTTKGDLIVHGSSTTRLGVGSDAQVLTADSAQSLGLKWAAVGSSGSVVKQIQGPVIQSADNSSTLTSTSIADYPNLSTISLTTSAGTTLIVDCWGVAHLLTNNAYLYVQVDSGSNTLVWSGFFSTNADYTIFGRIFVTGLSAAAHTVKLRYKIDSGATFRIRAATATEALAMCVTEYAN